MWKAAGKATLLALFFLACGPGTAFAQPASPPTGKEGLVRLASAESRRSLERLASADTSLVVKSDDLVRQLGRRTSLGESAVSDLLAGAATERGDLGESSWIKTDKRTLRFFKRAQGPAGLLVDVAIYEADVAEIERRCERGELTRDQADLAFTKLAIKTGVEQSGPLLGTAIGTIIFPAGGGFIGGSVGGFASDAAVQMMAATGLDDKLATFLTEQKSATISTVVGMAQTRGKQEVVTIPVDIVLEGESKYLGSRNYVKVSVPCKLVFRVDLSQKLDITYDAGQKVLTIRMPTVELDEPVPDREAAEVLEATKGGRRRESSVWKLKDWLLDHPLKPEARRVGEAHAATAQEAGRAELQRILQELYKPVDTGIKVVVK